jgi:DNA invertase Pin-like site-specific DNA recombinase
MNGSRPAAAELIAAAIECKRSPGAWTIAMSLAPHKVREGEPHRLYVTYYRVSTGQQGRFGFSIEAQRAAVKDYVAANPGVIIGEFCEVMSGRKDARPELAKAVSLCRVARAALVIARLDRLSRNVEMIARLMESGLEFVAADFPHANRFTIHILAAVAEYESRLNSERMKEAIAARRERGARIGSPVYNGTRRFPPGCQRASAIARKTRSEARARDLAPLVWKAVAEGKSMSVIAEEFKESGIAPPARAPWSKNSIWRIARQTVDEFGQRPAAGKRLGTAQNKVRRRVGEISPLLLAWWRDGKTYREIAAEFRWRGVSSPGGGDWGPASIRRYLMRAQNVSMLRAARGNLT